MLSPYHHVLFQSPPPHQLEELKNFTKDERESVDAAATKNITERINCMSETMKALQQQLQEVSYRTAP